MTFETHSLIGSSKGLGSEHAYLQRVIGAICSDLFVGNGQMLRLRGELDGQEFSIRSWACVWQIRSETRIVCASGDDSFDSEILSRFVRGQRIEKIEVEEQFRNLNLHLQNGCSILMIVNQSVGDDYAHEWSLHLPGETHLMVLAGGRWKIDANS